MSSKKYHFQNMMVNSSKDDPTFSFRYFWWPFSKKKGRKFKGRSGALHPEEVKKTIKEVGIGKQVEIVRIGFDGGIDDMPVVVEILDISESYFTGKIVNLERQMIESATSKIVYAKQGGGVLEFNYDDGDIKEISVTHDQELIEQERNIDGLREILQALDTGDHVIVAYYDGKNKGTINTEGVILNKNEVEENFTLQIEKINHIELEKKITKEFDIKNDLVIDIELV